MTLILRFAVFCAVISGYALAQNNPARNLANGLTILELKCSKRVNPPLPAGVQPQRDILVGQREPQPGSEIDALRKPSTATGAHMKAPTTYVYSLKLSNAGAQSILGILWEYVAVDPADGTELNRRRIINYQKIKRGSVVTLNTEYPGPPSHLVTQKGLGKNEGPAFQDRAEIMCVLYKDKSFWEIPNSDSSTCDELRKVDAEVQAQKRH